MTRKTFVSTGARSRAGVKKVVPFLIRISFWKLRSEGVSGTVCSCKGRLVALKRAKF